MSQGRLGHGPPPLAHDGPAPCRRPPLLAAEGAQEREACDGPEREVDDHEVRLLVSQQRRS